MESKIRGPVDACGFGVAHVGYVVDVLHAVLLTPDYALTEETGASGAGQETFAADGEGTPFCAEDVGEGGGGFDLG